MSTVKKQKNISEKKNNTKGITHQLSLRNYFFDVSLTANSIADTDGIIIQANTSFLQIWGYRTVEEVIGKHIGDFLDNKNEAAAILKTLNNVSQWEGYYTAKKKNGDTFEAYGLATVLLDDDGVMIGYQSSVLDITGRKRIEHQLNEAQRIAHIGSWELNLINNHLAWSDEIYRIFEINPALFGASYESFLNAIHPDDREMVNTAYTNSVNNRIPYTIDHRLLFPDGRIKYVQEQCETFYAQDSTPLRSIGTVQDITGRKQSEEELREQERQSASLLRLSRNLERAQTYAEVLNAALDEVKTIVGYQTLETYLLTEDKKHFKALVAGGPISDTIMSEEGTAMLTIEGDKFLEELVGAKDIVVVEDAQTDERTNKEIVVRYGFRTIVNVPIILFDRHLGCVGMCTIGDEGVRVPSNSEKKFLRALASHMAVSFDRIHLSVERKRAEESLYRLNRKLRAIRDCNQILLRAVDEQILLNDLCHIICDEAGYAMSWVGFPEYNMEKTVRPAAWAGTDDGYLASVNITWADTERGRGPTGTAIRNGESVIVQDSMNNPSATLWRDDALHQGYRSSIALPLKDENAKTFGALTIYSAEPNAFTPDEILLMEELAGDLAFGIVVLRARTERKQAEEDRLAHLRFFESMNRVNKAIVGTSDLEQLMSVVLQTTLSIFDCDRAWLLYPCDPDSATFRVPMEITKPEYPGAKILDIDIPMSPGEAQNMREALASDIPVTYTAGTDRPVTTAKQFGVQSQMFTPLYPKLGKPWVFGIHQCSHARVWTIEELKLFQEISRRLTDALASLLTNRKLQESEERFRRIAENAQDVIYRMLLPDGIYEYISPAAFSIFGYTPEEYYNSPMLFKNAVHPDWQNYFKEQWENLIHGNMLPTYEFAIIHKSGEVRWLNQRNILVRDRTGTPIAIEGIATDVTERKLSEKALIESEERYRGLFEENLAGTFVSTSDGMLLNCNDAFLQIFRFTSLDEAKHTNLNTLYSGPNLRKHFINVLQREKRIQNYEQSAIRKDGTHADIIENVVGKFDASGTLVELQGFIFDDTKRRELERELIQVQKLESLGTIAGGVAHDFNNILGIIMSHSSMLSRWKDNLPLFEKSVDAILKATNRGASLVKQLLTIARKTELNVQPVQINDHINETVKLLEETFPKSITVSTSFQQNLPFVLADPTQLHQIILNLCVNARDAMPNGGSLSLSTKIVSGEALKEKSRKQTALQYIGIEVTDTGMGIDDATLQKIFEPFFTTKDPGKGTGLGLSLVFSIVENHHGVIDVQSMPGVGTTFAVYLPIPEQTNDSPELEKIPTKTISGGKETILVIEDEELLRKVVEIILVDKGYTVITAEDGIQGVEKYKANADRIALILSDLGLPRLSGNALLKKIQEINPKVKMIIASGFIDPEIRSQLYQAGIKHFIQKPYTDSEILNKIRLVLDTVP